MKYSYLSILIASLALLAGCKHKVELQDQEIKVGPGTNDVRLGPGHKRIEIRSPKDNRKLLIVDVYEEGRQIEIKKDAQGVRIRHK